MTFLFFALFLLSSVLTAQGQRNKVVLPDYVGPPLNMYSGYIVVDQKTNRSLFYWIVEKETNPSNAPVVVWYQGGPGCSGLYGLLTENGPFLLDTNGKLTYRNLGWTKEVTMVYVEQPAGVGFSYSDSRADYFTDDDKAAADNHRFISGLLQQFPEYKGRDLWLTGESYAGVYVPMVATLLLKDPQIKDQFRGLMVGNPVFNCAPPPTTFLNLYWHGLVSQALFLEWNQNDCQNKPFANLRCQQIVLQARSEIGIINQQTYLQSERRKKEAFAKLLDEEAAFESFSAEEEEEEFVGASAEPSLDPDDIYQDFCLGNATLEFTKNPPRSCGRDVGQRVVDYLNRRDVQAALGVHHLGERWTSCAMTLVYVPQGKSLVPNYQEFKKLKPSFSVLVYSGDVDILTVPFPETMPCIYQIDDQPISVWRPWTVNGATAGYVEDFKALTYATVKGAGHEVPGYQPLSAFELFRRFLNTQNLTSGF